MATQTYIDVDAAITAAKQALDEKNRAMEKVAIIRTDLRNAVTMGGTSKEQTEWIEGTFPIRERKRNGKPAPVVAQKSAA